MEQEKIQKIESQAIKEISFARQYKQGKISNWQKNEQMYYGKKVKSEESRANVDLGRMQEFVHTLLSKIDNPLVFKYTKRKEAQLKRVELLNSLRAIDQNINFWDIKDIVGKKQAIMYGRAIYAYYADSVNGYQSHLENIDCYDFLIDPSAGGLDIELAMFLGDYGVVKTRQELESGATTGEYIKENVNSLLQGAGNNNESTQETTNKQSRTYDQNTTSPKEMQSDDKFKFWRWFTTFEGERYMLLLNEKSGSTIKISKLTDVCASGLYPYWTWAAFPDMTEFWTPSYCDYVRELFMAQTVSINQMLDNAEAVNKPMKVVNISAIENLASLKYRRDGNIFTKGDFDANKAIQLLAVPSIDTPIKVFNTLEAIQSKASGVTDIAKGVSDETGKVGIYEGNLEAIADRFGLLNKSYAYGYTRFARLYEHGVREHLTKKVAVDIIGPNGVEVISVSKRDLFKKNDSFGVLVEASDAEQTSTLRKQGAKVAFLTGVLNNPNVVTKINVSKAIEFQAKASGFNEDEVRELMDVENYGNQELMSEADRDIESILDGEMIKPNANANNAYRQRFVDYMRDHEEDISTKQFNDLLSYLQKLDETIVKNEARFINKFQNDLLMQQTAQINPTIPRVPGSEGGPMSGKYPQISENRSNPIQTEVNLQ